MIYFQLQVQEGIFILFFIFFIVLPIEMRMFIYSFHLEDRLFVLKKGNRIHFKFSLKGKWSTKSLLIISMIMKFVF